MEINADVWLKILGVLLGGSALIIHLLQYFRRPKLVLKGPYAQNWDIKGVGLRRFVNFQVRSKNGRTASRCVARAIIMKHPENVTRLVEDYAIHWADVTYSGRSTGSEPIDIGIASQRLDVAFTVPNQSGGSWLAIPIALSFPDVASQAVLPPGEYVMRIAVSCENGRGDSRVIKLVSPNDWDKLEATLLNKDCDARRVEQAPTLAN